MPNGVSTCHNVKLGHISYSQPIRYFDENDKSVFIIRDFLRSVFFLPLKFYLKKLVNSISCVQCHKWLQ